MSMITPVVLALAVLAWSSSVAAQDPLTTAPEAYRVELENAWVRVVRVHYAAGAKLPVHTHPAGVTAYVYLSDSDGVVFRHEGGSTRAVTRPAVTTGSIRLAAGGEEHHTAENPAATASDFLRIQIKTMTSRNLRQRIARPALKPNQNSITVDYSSEPLVIQRVVVAPGQAIVAERVTMPSLWIAIASGDVRWIEELHDETITNHSAAPLEFVRLIVRTSGR